jgi:hypothetical protein
MPRPALRISPEPAAAAPPESEWKEEWGEKPAQKPDEDDASYASRLRRAAWARESRLQEIIAEELKSVLEGK